MNWKRGLNRLFVVGYGVWLLLLFVYMPWRALQSETKWLVTASTSSYSTPADLDEIRARISWGYQYGEIAREFREEPELWLVFLYPFVVYGLIYGAIIVVRWLLQGFGKAE